MKKSTKLIAMLTVIVLLAGLLAVAIADDKIYTSSVFSIPKNRIDSEMLELALQLREQPEEPDVTEEPEAEPDVEETPPEEQLPDEDKQEGPVEPQVLIFSSRKETVVRYELITLSSKLIGFDGMEVHYQWQVDRGDGNGWVVTTFLRSEIWFKTVIRSVISAMPNLSFNALG